MPGRGRLSQQDIEKLKDLGAEVKKKKSKKKKTVRKKQSRKHIGGK